MKSIITEKGGKFCSKRISALICLIASIVLAFYKYDSTIIIAFLTAGVGTHTMTIKE